MTEAGSILGTAQYLAPEQAQRRAGRRAHRPLLGRRRPLRDAHRRACPSRATAPSPWRSSTSTSCRPSRPSWCPACRTRSTRSCSRRSPKTPTGATAARPSSPPTCAPRQAGGPLRGRHLRPRRRAHPDRGADGHPRRAGDARHERGARPPPARGGRTARPRAAAQAPALAVAVAHCILAVLAVWPPGGVLIYNAAFGSAKGVPSVVGSASRPPPRQAREAGFKVTPHERLLRPVRPAGSSPASSPRRHRRCVKGGIVDIWVSKGSTTVDAQRPHRPARPPRWPTT